MFISDAETQTMLNESFENNFTLSFDSWISERQTVYIQLEFQVVISNAQNIKSTNYLAVAHQTADRIVIPNIANNIAVFGNLDVRKFFVDIYGVRYPRDGVSSDYASNDYVDQCRDLKQIYKEYVGEELLDLFIKK